MNSAIDESGAVPGNGTSNHFSAVEGPVVIVDDDPGDALHAEAIIEELQPRYPVQIITSGEDLVAYLKGEGLYQDRSRYPYPGLVLLDLKMPKMDGFAVLEWLKDHPEHAEVPVVALSGFAGLVEQVMKAYNQGARSFLPKPVQLVDIQSILGLLRISI